MNLDDLKYKCADLRTALTYKIDDLKASKRGMAILGGGAMAGVLLIVFAAIWIPRLAGSGDRSQTVRVADHRGSDQQWIDQASAAIASDARFGTVRIEAGTSEDGAAIIRVSGHVTSMTDRMALLGKFVEVGKRDNVSVEVDVRE
jgi:hypothetical protein